MRTIIIVQISKYKIMISQNGAIFSTLSILKTLSFSLVAEALTGLIYHCPVGENSSFSSVLFMTFAKAERFISKRKWQAFAHVFSRVERGCHGRGINCKKPSLPKIWHDFQGRGV